MKIYYEKLKKETINGLKNKAYSVQEVEQIHTMVRNRYLQKNKGFVLASCIILGVLILMTLMMLPMTSTTGNNTIVFSMGLTTVVCALILIGVKIFVVDLIKNQFVKALRVGYPELEATYGVETFKKNKN